MNRNAIFHEKLVVEKTRIRDIELDARSSFESSLTGDMRI